MDLTILYVIAVLLFLILLTLLYAVGWLWVLRNIVFSIRDLIIVYEERAEERREEADEEGRERRIAQRIEQRRGESRGEDGKWT